MKKIKNTYLSLKATILISFLSVLGFTSCDGGDIQPEYGVPTVRAKSIKLQQEENDLVIKKDIDSFDSAQREE
ncbi:MAG: hypothetical protein PHH30_00870 [Bacteroidales bacterium]|nr:hypothetical protein [Bacteroidales bacterium]MDD3859351.1 hypothetical protein [Bacteroidales bacterium]